MLIVIQFPIWLYSLHVTPLLYISGNLRIFLKKEVHLAFELVILKINKAYFNSIFKLGFIAIFFFFF